MLRFTHTQVQNHLQLAAHGCVYQSGGATDTSVATAHPAPGLLSECRGLCSYRGRVFVLLKVPMLRNISRKGVCSLINHTLWAPTGALYSQRFSWVLTVKVQGI